MRDQNIVIGVVGACGSGKSSLVAGLSEYDYHARHIAQEHSFAPDMWQRLTKPDVLIFLNVSYPVTLQRKHFTWTLPEYEEQLSRLRHANQHADLHIDTDDLTTDEVLRVVLDYLGAFEGEEGKYGSGCDSGATHSKPSAWHLF